MEQTIKSLLEKFKEYLCASNEDSFKQTSANSYVSYLVSAIRDANPGVDLDAPLTNAAIWKNNVFTATEEYLNEDKSGSKTIANQRSSLKKFKRFCDDYAQTVKTNFYGFSLVKCSRSAFRAYLKDAYVKTDGTKLTPDTINSYLSYIKIICSATVYDCWWEVSTLEDAFDNIYSNTHFSDKEINNCRSALGIFIDLVEKAASPIYQSLLPSSITITKYAGGLISLQ